MKITRKLKLRIIIGIAIAMIVFGVLDRIFIFNIDPKVVSNVSMIFMILAFALLFSRSGEDGKAQGTETETKETVDESQLEQTALENDMIKDQDKGPTNNDDTRNDLRS